MTHADSLEEEPSPPLYELGKLRFILSGADPILGPLHEEFESLGTDGSSPPHLDFRFVDDLPGLGEHTRQDFCWVSSKGYRVEGNGFRYQVHKDDPWRVFVGPGGWRQRAPEVYHKAKNWNYLSPAEVRAKNFIYTLFDYISQISQLPLGQSYIHASSMEKDGHGVLVTAWGGIGKTTTALKLTMEDGWRFLSDDLSLVDTDARVHPVPKKMQVYAYNLVGQNELARRLMEGRSLVDKASWAWFKRRKGPSGVRRRISAQQLLGEASVGRAAKVGTVVHLERYSGRDLRVQEIEPEDLIKRCRSTLTDELSPIEKISAAVNSTVPDQLVPSIGALEKEAERIYQRAFGDAELHLVRVPFQTEPETLAKAVREVLE